MSRAFSFKSLRAIDEHDSRRRAVSVDRKRQARGESDAAFSFLLRGKRFFSTAFFSLLEGVWGERERGRPRLFFFFLFPFFTKKKFPLRKENSGAQQQQQHQCVRASKKGIPYCQQNREKRRKESIFGETKTFLFVFVKKCIFWRCSFFFLQ